MTQRGEVDPRRRSRRKAALVLIPTGAALGAGAVIASGAIPAADGTVGFCYSAGGAGQGRTTAIVESAADCAEGQQFITISQKGPAGPAGAGGAPGAPGAPGAAGAPGLGVPVHPVAAVDMFLEIEGIKGESLDDKHKSTIEIDSFSFGESNGGIIRSSGGSGRAGSGGGGGAGKVQFQDFHFVKQTDASSPPLFTRAASGQHIKKAVLFVRKAGGGQQEYLRYTLSDCLVTSFGVGSQPPTAGEPGPIERISFNYQKIRVEYLPIKPDGSVGAPVQAGWDLGVQKKL